MPVRTVKRGKVVLYGKVQENNQIRTHVCKNIKEAKAWEAMMMADTSWAYPKPAVKILTVLGWVNHYLSAMKDRKLAESTLSEKVTAFETLMAEDSCVTRDMAVADITVGMADACLRARMRTGSGYAANKTRKNLSAAWSWGVKHLGLPKDNPFASVDRFPEVRKDRYIPSIEDFMRVYSAAITSQDKLLLLSLLDTAARKRELLSLKWEDVDLEGGRIRLHTKKRLGGSLEADWIPMSSRLKAQMQAHATAKSSNFVFTRPDNGQPYKHRQHWLKWLCGIAGVRCFDIHAIRHLSATRQVHAGLSLTEIQGVLRHRSATTTNRYLHQLTGVQVSLDRAFREIDLPA